MHKSVEEYPEKLQEYKTGELLVLEGLISPSDVEMVLSIQKNRKNSFSLTPHRFFGMILCDLNLITPVDLYFVLSKYHKHTTINDVLIHENKSNAETLSHLKNFIKQTEESYFDLLVKKKLISLKDLQKTIFDLYHIPYKRLNDISFIRSIRSSLEALQSYDESINSRTIPLAKRDTNLLFGITDPECLTHIRILDTRLPQYRIKTIFIPFQDYTKLFKAIYGKSFSKLSSKDTITRTKKMGPDLSLLFSFKTTLSNPVKEKNVITALYKRYKILMELTGSKKQRGNIIAFTTFITEKYNEIRLDHGCNKLEISLRKLDHSIEIIAVPIH